MNTSSSSTSSIFLSSAMWKNGGSRPAGEEITGKTQGTFPMEISEQDLFDGVQHLGRLIWSSNDNATGRRVNPAKGKILRFSSAWHLWKLNFALQ